MGAGDLSLVYPLARGSAPLFAAVFALLFLGEQVTGPGRLGIALIGLGIYTLHLRTLAPRGWLAPLQSLRTRPSQLALLTGLTIAGYSVLDKAALGYFPPLLYLPLVFLLPLAMLAPYMLSARRSALRAEWSRQRRQIVVVATLMPLTYLLVLWTLTTTNVSYVAAVREVAVVPAALFGTLLLREPFGRSKLLGAGADLRRYCGGGRGTVKSSPRTDCGNSSPAQTPPKDVLTLTLR